jgi:hypothetical protein
VHHNYSGDAVVREGRFALRACVHGREQDKCRKAAQGSAEGFHDEGSFVSAGGHRPELDGKIGGAVFSERELTAGVLHRNPVFRGELTDQTFGAEAA